MNTTRKQFTVYLIAAFSIACVLQIAASIFALKGNTGIFQILLAINMFSPLAATAIARIPFRGMGWKPMLKGNVRYIFVALWLNSILMILGAGIFFLIFPESFDRKLTYFTSVIIAQAGEQAIEQLEAQGISLPIYLVISAMQALTIAPFFNMFIALGEEVGWRGAMTPFLKEKLGTTKGRLISGIIWGIWHWPVIILAGYEYGTDYIGAPILGPLVFCLYATAAGILIDWIYDKTKCIWFPSLMHGAINAFVTLFPYLVKAEYSRYSIFGPAYIGLISMIPLLIASSIIMIKSARETRDITK